MDLERLTDQELLVLARDTPPAFGVFYRRHVHAIHGYFRRRVFEVEAAFDLTAETFAAALRAVPRYEPRPEPARAWLFGIARNTLLEALRRGQVEDRARRALAMGRSCSTRTMSRRSSCWATRRRWRRSRSCLKTTVRR
jgi:RNA polymerase sigma factor (sigma-70 family)